MLGLEDIHTFYGEAHVLHGVSLAVKPGALVTLLGRNGAGKSTTLRSIMGIVPVRRGRIMFSGHDITNLAPEDIARFGIGYVPEDRRIFPNLTVQENLRLGVLGGDGSADRPKAYSEVFRYFPVLADRLGRRGGLLSGGEQQMLAIGRAMVGRPTLMLVDEPTEGLAPLLVKNLVGALCEINKQGTTILLVEQNLEVALALSTSLYVIDQGEIRFEGTADDLRHDTAIQKRLLGV
jgi:branched-chain amino acid transport system ATP-binding protein